jgi:hypothetical protein
MKQETDSTAIKKCFSKIKDFDEHVTVFQSRFYPVNEKSFGTMQAPDSEQVRPGKPAN